MLHHWIRGVLNGIHFIVTCQPTFMQCALGLCSSNLIIFLVTLNYDVSFNTVFIILTFSDTVNRVLAKGEVILRMTEWKSSAKKLILRDWGNQWKMSYYLGWDSTSDSPELPRYFVLFCFRTRNILGIIYSQSLMFLHCKQLCVLCAKFIKLTRGGDGSKLSRAHVIP